MDKFIELLNKNVNEKIEKRKDASGLELSYLSWSWAWAEFKKVYPEATYEIKKFPDEKGNYLPYMQDINTGYMVNTEITAGGITYEMWLPVMNSVNKAMKSVAYEYKTKSGVKSVEPATMFDVNKAIMRCLVKNMAMFGLGLYIYAGEDLPENEVEEAKTKTTTDLRIEIESATNADELKKLYNAKKAEICSNPELLNLITERNKKFKGVA